MHFWFFQKIEICDYIKKIEYLIYIKPWLWTLRNILIPIFGVVCNMYMFNIGFYLFVNGELMNGG